jgi:acyl dehydratase
MSRVATPLVVPDIASLKALVGQKLGVSDWFEVTQERVDMFAESTCDRQWIHVDPERAKRESPFGGTIAHGHYTLSLTPWGLGQILEVRGVRMMVNPGVEKVRFREPVRVGQRIRMHATLRDFRAVPGGGARITVTATFEIEGTSRPALIGDAQIVYFP